jgi:hypothetical protein
MNEDVPYEFVELGNYTTETDVLGNELKNIVFQTQGGIVRTVNLNNETESIYIQHIVVDNETKVEAVKSVLCRKFIVEPTLIGNLETTIIIFPSAEIPSVGAFWIFVPWRDTYISVPCKPH